MSVDTFVKGKLTLMTVSDRERVWFPFAKLFSWEVSDKGDYGISCNEGEVHSVVL